MKHPKSIIFALAVPFLLGIGCSAVLTNPRAVSMQDVIYLTQHQLGPDVIIAHLAATDSRFDLTTEDLVTLKDAGVDERVIQTMVERSVPQQPYGQEIILPPAASYGPLNRPLLNPYNSWNYPLNESYYRFYNYPYSPYIPLQRQGGLIGRFYEDAPQYLPPPAPVAIPEGARRSDSAGIPTGQDETVGGAQEK